MGMTYEKITEKMSLRKQVVKVAECKFVGYILSLLQLPTLALKQALGSL